MKRAFPAAAAAALVIGGLGCASAPQITPPQVQDALKVPGGNVPVVKAHAQGAQVYQCKPKKDAPETFEWVLKGPDATLTGAKGERIGTHYEGPTWEHVDGSKVVAAAAGKADAPEQGAIPWLLLKAKSNEGSGVFSRVTYVQRVDTRGGKAPATDCGPLPGAETRVDYTATYYFYAPAP